MANIVATPVFAMIALTATSPTTILMLVWSDAPYFQRNCTISTMQFSLHSDNHDQEGERWYFIDYKFFLRVSIPSFYYLHH
jgi:hypothetical protein